MDNMKYFLKNKLLYLIILVSTLCMSCSNRIVQNQHVKAEMKMVDLFLLNNRYASGLVSILFRGQPLLNGCKMNQKSYNI
jgi:hypothetical protein